MQYALKIMTLQEIQIKASHLLAATLDLYSGSAVSGCAAVCWSNQPIHVTVSVHINACFFSSLLNLSESQQVKKRLQWSDVVWRHGLPKFHLECIYYNVLAQEIKNTLISTHNGTSDVFLELEVFARSHYFKILSLLVLLPIGFMKAFCHNYSNLHPSLLDQIWFLCWIKVHTACWACRFQPQFFSHVHCLLFSL